MGTWSKAVANADLTPLAATKVEAKLPDYKLDGVPPAQLRRCLIVKAKMPKGVDAPKSADDRVLLEIETNKLRERCVWSLIAKYGPEKTKKAAAK